MNITEFRKQYPQYDDIPDQQLAQNLHKKYYSDIPFEEFSNKFIPPAPPGVTPFTQGEHSPEPESFLRKATRSISESMPIAGSIFGGGIGTILGTGGGGIGAVPGGIAGSALGAGAGKSIQQLIAEYLLNEPQGSATTQALQVGKETAGGALSEITGLGAGKVIEKALAPGAKKLIPGAQALFQKAKAEGLPLSPDVFTKSKFTKAVRWVSDELPPGNWEAARMRGKINEMLMDARKNFITDTLKMQKPGAGMELRKKGSEIFAEAEKTGKGQSSKMANLKTFLNENILNEDLKVSKNTHDALVKAHKKLAETDSLDIKDINDLYAKVWGGQKYGKMSGSQQRIHGQLKSALDADMDAFEKASNSQVYSLIKEGRSLYKSAAEADKAKVIENMLSAATKYDADKQIYSFHPIIFKNQIERNMPKLEKIFRKDPSKIEMIKKFSQEMEIAATDIARLSRATSVGGMAKEGLKLSTGAGLGFLGLPPIAMAVPAGFNIFMAHSLMNPRGLFKTWLTVGPSWGKTAAELGKQATKAGALKVFDMQNLQGETTLK